MIPFVVVTAATLAVLHWVPNRYRSETLILVVPQRVPESYVKATVTTKIEERLQSISQQILSRTRLERIIQDFDLYVHERAKRPIEDVIEQMRKEISVRWSRATPSASATPATKLQMAMKVTERLASLFIEENLRDREVLARRAPASSSRRSSRMRGSGWSSTSRSSRPTAASTAQGKLPSQLQSNLRVVQNAPDPDARAR